MINPHDLERHYSDTSRICGIYFLFKANDLIYIGQSVDVFSRITQHRRANIDFDFFSYVWCEKRELNSTELNYILYHKPVLNKNHYVGKKYRPEIKKPLKKKNICRIYHLNERGKDQLKYAPYDGKNLKEPLKSERFQVRIDHPIICVNPKN